MGSTTLIAAFPKTPNDETIWIPAPDQKCPCVSCWSKRTLLWRLGEIAKSAYQRSLDLYTTIPPDQAIEELEEKWKTK